MHWTVLTLDEAPNGWNRQRAEQLFTETKRYWRGWMRRLTPPAACKRTLLRSAMIIHLLDFAPDGSLVAAPTTSLPERIGGDKNDDYRYTWVRDASLAVTGLSLLGDQATPRRYLEWMVKRHSTSAMPLQVAYRIDGAAHLTQVERADLAGYRESPPVRVGNRAATQVQPGALGYLADCMLTYLEHG